MSPYIELYKIFTEVLPKNYLQQRFKKKDNFGSDRHHRKFLEKIEGFKIVPMDFAEEKLYEMAGYRNRLTHFYFEISPKEMYEIVQNRLDDFRIFLKYVKKLIKK